METSDQSLIKPEMSLLRESIKNKYKQYHITDPGHFPLVEFNTNRTNYGPLRASFEEEFYVVRGIDRTSPNIHIPSTNTLSLLFCDDSYVPSKKILNTCRSYAEGKSGVSVSSGASAPISSEPAITNKPKGLAPTGLGLLASLVVILALSRWFAKPAASELVIDRPTARSTVSQEVIVEGKAINAETVWLVVHAEKSLLYWIQPPVKVQDNGMWIGVIYIGGVSYGDAGLLYQVRAFVDPDKKLTSGMILKGWPRAKLASDSLEVIKGSKPN